jgi:hypothetical protein
MKKSLILFFVTIILFFGCGRDYSRPVDLPPLVPCKIMIKQDGVPFSDCTVTIFNKDSVANYGMAGGVTNRAGVAELKMYGFQGVPVGNYKVTVSKTVFDESEVETTVDKFGDKWKKRS